MSKITHRSVKQLADHFKLTEAQVLTVVKCADLSEYGLMEIVRDGESMYSDYAFKDVLGKLESGLGAHVPRVGESTASVTLNEVKQIENYELALQHVDLLLDTSLGEFHVAQAHPPTNFRDHWQLYSMMDGREQLLESAEDLDECVAYIKETWWTELQKELKP